MSSREQILERVRANAPSSRPLPSVPAFAFDTSSLIETFRNALERMGGALVQGTDDVRTWIDARFPEARVICSATPEVPGTRALDAQGAAANLADVDVGIVRALIGVAETGSVLVTEAELRVNAIAFLSQHLVVLLDPADIVPNLHDAYRHPALRSARYATLLTGPSATADIEGVLVRGAQGVRSLTVIARTRPAA